VYNLFDANYADPAGPDFTQDAIPQNGRSFRVKLTYRF
jgi:iron complex outermembrane receptor protein